MVSLLSSLIVLSPNSTMMSPSPCGSFDYDESLAGQAI